MPILQSLVLQVSRAHKSGDKACSSPEMMWGGVTSTFRYAVNRTSCFFQIQVGVYSGWLLLLGT